MNHSINEHHILFILDRSGSMHSRMSDTIGGFNSYIDDLRRTADADCLKTYVTLVLFNNTSKIVYSRMSLDEVPALTERTYVPSGNTALLDAVYKTVHDYRESLGQGEFGVANDDAPPVLVVIFTDGKENSSREVTTGDVRTLIAECENLGNWTFAYVGEHAEGWNQAETIGIRRGSVLQNDRTGIRDKMAVVADRTRRTRKEMLHSQQKRIEDFIEESQISSK